MTTSSSDTADSPVPDPSSSLAAAPADGEGAAPNAERKGRPPGRKKRDQTVGEEIANSITHGLGAIFGLAALVAMLWVAIAGSRSITLILSLASYGLSLFLLYMASTLYHALTHRTAKRVFQILDHSSIYLLIAGTYTPFCLAIGGWQGLVLALVEWVLAVTGIVFEAVWHSRPGWLTVIVYIAMGWLAIFVIGPVAAALSPAGIWLMVGGGLAYTFGVIFYAMRNVRYMHAVWHLFVLLGSILQFLAVLLYIIPQT
jgi:hemolysin III